MLIKVVSLGPVTTKRGPKSSYGEFELTYKDVEGRSKNKKLFSFNKAVYDILSAAEPGQSYDVKVEKKSTDRGEFWEWLSATRVENAPEPAAQAARGSAGGGWKKDSPETEARIARSVALKAAVDFHAFKEDREASADDVIETAALFEHYLANGYISEAFKKVSSDGLPDDSDDILNQ